MSAPIAATEMSELATVKPPVPSMMMALSSSPPPGAPTSRSPLMLRPPVPVTLNRPTVARLADVAQAGALVFGDCPTCGPRIVRTLLLIEIVPSEV
ncbi:MAG: hypothetical protein EBZ36_07560 [Acidobacteria bacterium]|nr:hypothetical protein [Acidobacteriota bacterium]